MWGLHCNLRGASSNPELAQALWIHTSNPETAGAAMVVDRTGLLRSGAFTDTKSP